MKKMAHPTEKFEFKSTLYDKLAPEERRRLNRAIVDRIPPTYQACYDQFRLADRGIGFYVFYRYARNLRRLASVTDLADANCPEADDPVALNEAITQLLTYRLVDALDDETADSHVLHRLTRAYERTVRVALPYSIISSRSAMSYVYVAEMLPPPGVVRVTVQGRPTASRVL